MLGLKRAGLLRLAYQHRLLASAAVASSSSSSREVSLPPRRRTQRDASFIDKGHNTTNNNNPKSSIPIEQYRLQKKHEESLKASTSASSLHELCDHVEWKITSNGKTLQMVQQLLIDPKQEVKSLSDRQLAVLFSVYGEKCASATKDYKMSMLSALVTHLSEIGVNLGPLSRTALLAARVDNNELPSVVDELNAWEEAGYEADEGLYQQLARIYALNGNTQGVVDIINHMKSSGMTVGQPMMEAMIYSLAKIGHYEQADKLIKKLSRTMNEVKLSCTLASAAITRGDDQRAVDVIAGLSTMPKFFSIENNKYVLQILTELVESGDSGAVDKIRPYLTCTPDGNTIVEWHENIILLSAIKRNLHMGKLDAALSMLPILAPKYINQTLVDKVRGSLVNYLKNPNSICEKAKEFGAIMESQNILDNHELFLLEASLDTSHGLTMLEIVKAGGRLEEYIKSHQHIRRPLAKMLSEALTSNKLTNDERATRIGDVATILFAVGENESLRDGERLYQVMNTIGGKDIDIAIKALKMLPDDRIRCLFATSLVWRLIKPADDVLAMEKLNKLLKSGAILQLNANLLHNGLRRMISKSEDPKEMKMASKIIALAFPSKEIARSNFAVKNLIDIVASESVSVEKMAELMKYLEKEPRVTIYREDFAAAKKVLIDSKQVEKAQLLERLKIKKTTYARWTTSSIEDLEAELINLKSKRSEESEVTLRSVILNKLRLEKPFATEKALRHLNDTPNMPKLMSIAAELKQEGVRDALSRKDLATSIIFWDTKPIGVTSVSNAMSLIAQLYLSGQTDRADAICEQLRTSAETITPGALRSMGTCIGTITGSEMDLLCKYLKSKFNLIDQDLRHIGTDNKKNALNELLKTNHLEEAYQMACQETKESGVPFEHFRLFEAAIKAGNQKMVTNIFNMVANSVGKNAAFLDLSFSLLEAKQMEMALTLLQRTSGLNIRAKKLEFFIHRAVYIKRPDILRGLFLGLRGEEKSSTVDMNKLLVEMSKLYYSMGDIESIISLETEVKEMNFPLELPMRRLFANINQDQQKKNEEKKERTD